MRGEIGSKETIPPDESDGVCEDGTRDGETRTQTGALHDRFNRLSLEAGVKLEMVDIAIKLLGGGRNFFVFIPFQERFVSSQAEILQRCKNLEMGTVGL